MFEDVTFESIMDSMLGRISDSYDKRESSPIYAALAPAALEIENIYAALGDMLDETYADTASREYLVRLAASRGLFPRAATYAVVRAEFTPDTVEIEAGAEFTGDDTGDELVYKVVEKIADGLYKLECTVAGEAGNAYTGEIIPVDDIENLETAVITEILIYGEAEEDTEIFRSRYMDSFKANAFSGNQADYQNKTLAVAGVGAVKVAPVWNGPGTVKLVILNTNFQKASEELVGKTQAVFDPEKNGLGDGLAPIGHLVTVDTVEEIPVQVMADITYDTGYDWNVCGGSVEMAVEAYFSALRKEWNSQDATVVRINSINMAMLSVHGVIDVSNTRLNGAGSNLQLGPYEIPTFGGILNE